MSKYSSNGTKIGYRTAATGNYTDLPLLMEVPELGATPEKIDVTTLGDKVKSYINGIKDYGDLVFKFLYDNTATGNYRVLKSLETTGADFELLYPDGTKHHFKAIPALKIDAGSINGALTFSCTMTLQRDITITNPSQKGAGSFGSAPNNLK